VHGGQGSVDRLAAKPAAAGRELCHSDRRIGL